GLGFGTPVEQIDPLGNTSVNQVDANGLAWLTVDPLGLRTRYYFNSSGLPTASILADDAGGDPGTSATYNSVSLPEIPVILAA
ncbi:MAG TPA: hypothetical protein VM661_18335, partial [Candidatus Sulfotelmatobacter sp.]|nr:hypothetical protein [Candidatus Sulfotelmatobacter sp.]